MRGLHRLRQLVACSCELPVGVEGLHVVVDPQGHRSGLLLRPRSGIGRRSGHPFRLGLCRSLVLLLDRRPDLFAVNGHLPRRLDADADGVAGYLHDLYDGAVADNDPFAGAAGDDEHVFLLGTPRDGEAQAAASTATSAKRGVRTSASAASLMTWWPLPAEIKIGARRLALNSSTFSAAVTVT